ncbi:MAG: sigma-70 family RNA polymerase sigma factor [Nannocystaceae bacterium]|nr:sigma-70 family RNA polymerase sigma factor [Nannocystaceae bacterium]
MAPRGVKRALDPICDPEAMVRLARAGDVRALERASVCLADRLSCVARRCCRTEEDARDAVQDTWVAAIAHLGDFRGEGSVEAWLSTMVSRACGRSTRGRKNSPGLHDNNADLACVCDDPEVQAERAQRLDQLRAIVQDVAPGDRVLVWLVLAQGWTAPEAAARLGIAPATARKRLSRLRAAIRARVQSQQDEVMAPREHVRPV